MHHRRCRLVNLIIYGRCINGYRKRAPGGMFLELAFQAPLGALQQPVNMDKGETWGFLEYFTAHRVVEQIHTKVSTRFKKIIKQCLHCEGMTVISQVRRFSRRFTKISSLYLRQWKKNFGICSLNEYIQTCQCCSLVEVSSEA